MNNKRKTLQKIARMGAIATVLPNSWVKPVINSVVLPSHAQTSNATETGVQNVQQTLSIEMLETIEHGLGNTTSILTLPKLELVDGEELLSARIIGQHRSTNFRQEVISTRQGTRLLDGSTSNQIIVGIDGETVHVFESDASGEVLICANDTTRVEIRSSATGLINRELSNLNLFIANEESQIVLELFNNSSFDIMVPFIQPGELSSSSIPDPALTLGSTSVETIIFFRFEFRISGPQGLRTIPDIGISGLNNFSVSDGNSTSSCRVNRPVSPGGSDSSSTRDSDTGGTVSGI